MLVVATPLIPAEDNQDVAKTLSVSLDGSGFLLEAHLKLRPVELSVGGIHVCGSAGWPTDVTEGVAQAYAASKAAGPLRMSYAKAEPTSASVNEDECSGRGVCEVLCPLRGIELQPRDDERAFHVNEAVREACSICGAVCPSGAISMHQFTDQRILGQAEALFN